MKKDKKIVVDNSIGINEALELLRKESKEKERKFVENIDLAINLSIDPKQSSQNIRGSVLLPAGSGKKVKIIVFTDDESIQKDAINAGATLAGLEDLMQKIESGFLDFDAVIATPESMKKIGKIAKILGPRGLMPNPKNGNITNDVVNVVKNTLKGKANIKNDKFGIVHVGVGKINFSNEDIISNVKAVISTLKDLKPETVKGKYIKNIFITSTMGSSHLISIDK